MLLRNFKIALRLVLNSAYFPLFFLVESTAIENAIFSWKTALSKVNVKRNKIGSTKWS